MSILLFGATGQIGRHIAAQGDCIAISRAECDLSTASEAAIANLIDHHQPTHIINATAYTKVDDAENDHALADALNVAAPAHMAAAAAARRVPFLHLSTDYVFDGKQGFYTETAPTNPLNHYGVSKLRGEQAALALGARVFRLQWVFDITGHNLLPSILRLLSERERITMVADQWGAPSYTKHLATAILAARDVPPGLYHMAPPGFTSRHGFTCAVAGLTGSTCRIDPITTAEFPRPAVRPLDTRLDISKLTALGITLPHWYDGLKEALSTRTA